MKMANLSLLLFVIFLAGTASIARSACNVKDCPFPSDPGTKDEKCRKANDHLTCLKSELKSCEETNTQEKKLINDGIKRAEQYLERQDCDTAFYQKQRGRESGNGAAGQVSSLFMCLGLANLAYFLTKFR